LPANNQAVAFTMKLGPCSVPNLSSINSNSSICSGQTASIIVTGTLNSANYWQISTGSCSGPSLAINPSGTFSVAPISNTTYYISGIGHCFTQQVCDSVQIIVNTCTGIRDLNTNNFQIYPNPVSESLTIKSNMNEKSHLSIYNSLGSLCQETVLKENETVINISNLKSGVYFIKIETTKGTINKKFIKE
jgi:hypothetical protein